VKVAAAIIAALVGLGGVASAEEKLSPERVPQKARELAEKGRAYHDAGEYLKAVAAFKEAYVLAPSPALLFNIAQAYRLAGDCDDAAWMYRRYLDTNPGPERRTLAETHLASVEKCGHGGLLVVTPPVIDAKTPTPATQPYVPPANVVDGTPASHTKQAALWVGIGGGIALAGAAYFAWDANDAASNVTDLYKHGGKGTDVAAQDARGQRSSDLAIALGIGGGLAVATAGVLYMVGRHYEAEHVAIAPHAHGAEVSLAWQF
jgi:tetratricopeptide (TPR) repeat protein